MKGNTPLARCRSAVVGPALFRGPSRIKESDCLQSENYYSWQSAVTLGDLLIFCGSGSSMGICECLGTTTCIADHKLENGRDTRSPMRFDVSTPCSGDCEGLLGPAGITARRGRYEDGSTMARRTPECTELYGTELKKSANASMASIVDHIPRARHCSSRCTNRPRDHGHQVGLDSNRPSHASKPHSRLAFEG